MTAKTLSLPDDEIGEALWAAYRREDKAAVMDYLFRQILVGISRSICFPHLVIETDQKRSFSMNGERGEPMRINGSSRVAARHTR
jgi:hypothetical protein